jgi:hypothetical protein
MPDLRVLPTTQPIFHRCVAWLDSLTSEQIQELEKLVGHKFNFPESSIMEDWIEENRGERAFNSLLILNSSTTSIQDFSANSKRISDT